MTIQHEVHRIRRLVPLRWERIVRSGDPAADAPDPDERGYGAPFRGPLVGITEGRTVRLKLVRTNLEARAPIFLTSTDTAVVTVQDPAGGALPATDEMEVHLRGESGGAEHRDARIEVHHGSATGPLLHTLHVQVFRPLDVDVTPHMVSIAGPGGAAAVAPVADVNAIMALVRAIWIHSGVTISVGTTLTKTITLGTAGIASDTPFPGELRILLANRWPDGTPNWVPNTINAFFVSQIGTASTLGFGFSRASFAAFGLPNPGIILGDRTAGGGRAGLIHYANDLAHEIGHFFTLSHPEKVQPPHELEDTWSRRRLMHNFNGTRARDPFPVNDSSGTPFDFRPRFNDVGYGVGRRGCFISLKDLPTLTTDNETAVARATITSAAGPF